MGQLMTSSIDPAGKLPEKMNRLRCQKGLSEEVAEARKAPA